jgi:large subunit ribosomal protein L31
MKQGIHPKYNTAKVTCACGNSFETGSTTGEIKTEICSQCHPFFTGKQRTVLAKGRVEQFKSKYGLE